MSKKTSKSNPNVRAKPLRSPGRNLLMTLTLVPLVVGIILIGAWVLDINIFDDPQPQIIVGIFFFLLSFTASNAVQRKWIISGSWGLLAIADIITLIWLNVAAQTVAILIGIAGLVLLGVQFYRQYQMGKRQGR